MPKGKFIVIEGLDGSGKSSQVDLVVDFLRQMGKEVVVTKEPTVDSESGRKIKQVLRKEIIMGDPLELQGLYVQDRKEHLENKVLPALQRGAYVVSSRYYFSTFAYGGADGVDVSHLIDLNKQFLQPDITIIVDVSAESCIQRIEGRGETKEHFEELEKLKRVGEWYRKFPAMFSTEGGSASGGENIFIVNGEQSVQMVFEKIKTIINRMEIDKFAPVFEDLGFSAEDVRLIAPFFTNLDKSVYSITFLPPELIGALCSRASRAKDDLRPAFLKEFVKPSLDLKEEDLAKMAPGDADEVKRYAVSLKALIEFLHQHPAELIFSNKKARDFYIKWLAQFGDDSIAQMAGAHLAYTGISQLAIKQIEDMRMGIAPIEKSTRYVDYSSKVNGSFRYYTDPTLESMGLLQEYKAAMDNLFETYTLILEKYQEFLKGKYPAEEERTIRTKAFDTARLLLPVATLSQVAFYGNGQAFEYMINRGLDHVLGEVRWSSQRAWEELNKVMPAFLRRLETEDSKNYRTYMSKKGERVQSALKNIGYAPSSADSQHQAVKLLEYDPEGEDKIIAGLIYQESAEAFDVILGKVKKMTVAQKEAFLQEVLAGRKAKYYKIPRAFENIYVRFEIIMNIGAWRDLHRHRTQTQMRQRFTPELGFDVPEGLKEAGLDEKYISATKQAEQVFEKIAATNPEMAQYCCTLGHRVRFMQYQNMRAFFWEAELRTTSQGHPDYRKIEQEKARQIQAIYPLIGKYLMVDFADYDFARRGDTKKIESKEKELSAFLNK